MPWEIWSCPSTAKSILFVGNHNQFDIEESLAEETFIGISLEAHLGVGGHVKIGFNMD